MADVCAQRLGWAELAGSNGKLQLLCGSCIRLLQVRSCIYGAEAPEPMGSAKVVENGHSEKMRLKIRQSRFLASCSAILLGGGCSCEHLLWMRHLAMASVEKLGRGSYESSFKQLLSKLCSAASSNPFVQTCWIREYQSLMSQEAGFPWDILSEN